MAQMMSRLTGLNMDLMLDILGRLDGPTVASVSCTCSNLRDAARDRELWRRACHSLWPSTSIPETEPLIPDFEGFYAGSYPLICHGMNDGCNKETATAPELGPCEFQDFTSLVDVYYERRCILSRASVPAPEALTISGEYKLGRAEDATASTRDTWFSNCPFHWDILELPQSDDSSINSDGNPDAQHHTYRRDQRTELEKDLRLSWVLLDKKTGRSVNLSSWVPVFSQRSWDFNSGKYTAQFGSLIPAEGSSMVKCTITVSCRFKDEVGAPAVEEIRLRIEDMTGRHLNGKESLMVLNRALFCSRSTDKMKVQEGFSEYEAKKRELMNKKEFKEKVATGVFTFIQVTVFVALVCNFSSRFT